MPGDSRAGDGRAVHSWTGKNLRALFFYGGLKINKENAQGKTEDVIKTDSRGIFDLFSYPIQALDPEEGITIEDYMDALDSQVRAPLRIVYLELCELINSLPENDMYRAVPPPVINEPMMFLQWTLVKVVGFEICGGELHRYCGDQRCDNE
jgi:hypothetical protein